MSEQPVTFNSDGLVLEGVLNVPDGSGPFPAVVVCHPHPRYGGTMYSNVVAAACWGLHRHSVATLRFNFRGVDNSQGRIEGGEGEVRDALNAVEWLRSLPETDASRIALAGYSFGAGVSVRAASSGADLKALGLIACPIPSLNAEGILQLPLPVLLAAGDVDHVAPADQLEAIAGRLAGPSTVHFFRGGDHFLLGHEHEVSRVVGDFFAEWLVGT